MDTKRRRALGKEIQLGDLLISWLQTTPQYSQLGDPTKNIICETFLTGNSAPLYALRGGEARCAIDFLLVVSSHSLLCPIISAHFPILGVQSSQHLHRATFL